jgi:hypothetical protein
LAPAIPGGPLAMAPDDNPPGFYSSAALPHIRK